MKLIHFISDRGNTCYGTADPGNPAIARIVTGAPFGAVAATGETAVIARLLPPVMPVAIFALGLNYGKHAEETSFTAPETPVVFMKAATSVIAPGEPILLPLAGPDRVDYEGELAVVIGRKAKNISPAEVAGVIAGYTCANDVTARDWQTDRQKGQWVRAKSFDTFCPLGPCLVTPDELPPPHALALRTILNERVVQEATTGDMIFPIPTLVSDLSRSLTLLPGTVILTGTPAGVGYTRRPPVYLREGDRITIEIEGIGRLSNPVGREHGR